MFVYYQSSMDNSARLRSSKVVAIDHCCIWYWLVGWLIDWLTDWLINPFSAIKIGINIFQSMNVWLWCSYLLQGNHVFASVCWFVCLQGYTKVMDEFSCNIWKGWVGIGTRNKYNWLDFGGDRDFPLQWGKPLHKIPIWESTCMVSLGRDLHSVCFLV